jgi:DnaJ-class molecular chaperone
MHDCESSAPHPTLPPQARCPDCQGEGVMVKEEDKCRTCRGSGSEKKEKILTVVTDKGMRHGDKVRARTVSHL